jgi:hypothetical protein
MTTLTALRKRLADRAARALEVDKLLAEMDTPSRLDRLDFRRMHPTGEQVDRIGQMMNEVSSPLD